MFGEKAILIENLTIGYKAHGVVYPVVSSINTELCRGELVSLVGRNGAGKSTFLRTVCGYQRELEGRVRYMGDGAERPTPQELSRRVAVVFAGSVKVQNLTVRELVALGRSPHTGFLGQLRPSDHKAVEWAMEVMGVASLAGRDVLSLSDGELQKCMIAKALAQETPVIILDEPTAFLDFQSKVALFGILKRLSTDMQKAILVSTHDIELALCMSDKLWVLDNKKMHCGTVDELSANGVIRDFVGSGIIKYNEQKKILEIE